ncbi:MAG TPA: Ig-like domain repeat protein, partial [Myxococcales bacterium]|nr:Ig-like domain repeat protein [Myxococcales bacterium]
MTLPRALSLRAARLLPAVALLAIATACPPPPPPPDTTLPDAAALAAGTVTDTSIQVRWTAVGDDGATGTATSYDLHQLSGAACPITQANFDSATAVSGLPAPAAPNTPESFTVTGLAGDTGYCFMLKVTDDAGNASFSPALIASTQDLVAPAPAVLSASSVGDTSVTLSWDAVGDNGAVGTASSSELRYASGAACPLTAATFGAATAASGLPSPSPAGTPTSFTVSGLTSAVDYCFMLKVADEAGNSSLSASLAVTTRDSISPAAAVLSVSGTTGSSVTLDWTAVGDDGATGTAASYQLRYLGGAACPITQANFATGTSVGGLPAPAAAGAAESFTVPGLNSDTAYCFMLKVTDDAGNSSFSNAAQGSTLDVTAPDAVALSVASVTGVTVQLSWLAVGDDRSQGTATSYDLRYASGVACPLVPATFGGATQVSGLGAPQAAGTAESAAVTGLASQTSYCFMLKVTDDAGNTSFSNSPPATTEDVLPPAPATLTSGVIAATSIQVLWNAVGDDGATGDATSYEMRYRSGASCPIDAANFSSSTLVTGLSAPRSPGTPESFIVQGLTSDTGYCILLKVSDEAGNSSFSNQLTASTPDVTPPASAQLSPAAFDTQVVLNWTAVGDDGTTGTATSQELRYLSESACPIGAANFGSGTLVSGLGAPQAAGTPETFTVTGLTRQTTYCFALKVTDEAGNASVSTSSPPEITTPDTTPPAAAALSQGAATSRSLQVTWTATGDDGFTGTAASYDLRYLTGGACPVTSANFGSATAVPTGSPQAPGSAESATVSGLSPGTGYCFALKVVDDASNASALSNSLGASTDADTAVPGPVADLGVSQQGTGALLLSWTAVADDGTTSSTGAASSYELRYLSGAACPITAANFAGGTAVSGLPAPASPGSAESFSVTGLASQTSYCFLLKVTDAAGNTSLSNEATGSTPDAAPPAAVTDLAAAGPDAVGAVTLTWTAVGDDGTTGTATSYDLRYQGGSCATFDFATATQVSGLPSPGASGSTESFTLGGLSPLAQYCFGLQVFDDVGTGSGTSNTAAATPDPSAQMAQVRAAIHGATTSPVALNHGVRGAIVTYIKAGVGIFGPGMEDGPGFFVQNGGTGPALFFAMDPAVVLPGMAVSDEVNLTITEGAWLSCGTPPCTADNSMYVITQATASPTSTGKPLPAAQDLSSVALPLPIVSGPWDLEHERVSVSGATLGPVFAAGAGFEKAQLTTAGTSSSFLQLRVPDAVLTGKGLAAGCQVSVTDTPMWRFGPTAQVAAWQAGEVTPSGCPAIALSATVPADGATGVPPETPV